MKFFINEKLLRNIILEEINQNTRFNPTKANVYNAFNEINEKFFNNSLPLCNVEMITNKKYLGYFHYDGVNFNELENPTISINERYQYTITEFNSVVAHEMIHYYLAYNRIEMSPTHSDNFHALARDINAKLNLNVNDTVDTTNMGYNNQQNQINAELLGYMNSYLNSLKQYLNEIKKESKNQNGNLTEFYTNLYQFTVNVINALERCIRKRTLNEGIGQTMMQGVQTLLPLQSIGDFVNGYNEYSNKTKSWLTNGMMGSNYSQYYNPNNLRNKNGGLIYLLYDVYPKIKAQYQRCSIGYNSAVVTNEFSILDDLKNRINAITNNA